MARPDTKRPEPPAKPAADCGKSARSPLSARPTRFGRWRALALLLVHALIALHVAHWMKAGTTISPLEPSEAMEFSKHDLVNAGFVFFGLALLSTLVLGRWFCGWACHVVALQDACLWLLKRVGIRPKPLRSRALALVPALAAAYMFAWPFLARVWIALTRPEEDVFRPVRVALTKDDFWETFPPWPAALATFAVCGFVTVYFLGAKGFCTYACPYGALFGVADRFARGRIRVTDACEGCGHCTATCSSNVIVHEEVARFGMVVDAGCMKCLDCVAVCPKEALYFGFGAPSGKLSKQAGSRARASAPWREELLLAALFVACFAAYRGLYGVIPFLLALGIAGVLSVSFAALLRALSRPSATFLGRSLKASGRLTRAGRAFVAAMAAVTLLTLHGALVQVLSRRVEAAYEGASGMREALLDDPSRALAPDALAEARGGLESARLVRRLALLPYEANDQRLAWLALLAGAPAEFEAELRARAERAREPAPLRYDLARFLAARGRADEAAAELEAALASEPTPAAFDRLARLHFEAGRPEDALAAFRRALEAFPESADLWFNHGVALGLAGRLDEAERAFERALELDPSRTDARENLAGLRARPGAR